MAEIDRNYSFAIHASRRKKEQAYLQALKLYVAAEELEHPSLHVNYEFPRIEESLVQLQEHLDTLADQVEHISKIGRQINDTKAVAEYIDAYGQYLARKIEAVRILIVKKKYEEGIILLHTIHVPDNLQGYKFANICAEVASFLSAELYHKLGERRIQDNLLPYSEDEFASYKEVVAALRPGMHDQRQIDIFKDHIRGITFFLGYRDLKERALKPEQFDYYFNLIESHMNRGYVCSNLTQWRYNLLRGQLIERYNEACHFYFEEDPEYKHALALFKHKHLFLESQIQHPFYLECADEEMFKSVFLREDILRKEGQAFSYEVISILLTLMRPNDVAANSIADVYLDPEIPSKKKAKLEEILLGEPFTRRIYFVETCFARGAGKQEEAALVALLEGDKKRRKCDLEKVAPSLLRIRKRLSKDVLPAFDEVTDSLYRSARATKITRKTPINEVRELSRKNVGLPKGGRIAVKDVRGRGAVAYAFLWLLAFIIPIAIVAASFILIVAFCPQGNWRYAFLGPIGFAYIYILKAVAIHFDRDEHGAAVARRVIAVVCLLGAVWTLIYFISPASFPFFEGYGYTSIITISFAAIFTQLVLKETRPRLGFWLYWPVVATLVAALIFMIIDMMNGLI